MRHLLLFSVLFFSACSVKEYKLFQKEEPKTENQNVKPQKLNISYVSKVTANDILKIDIYNMNKRSNIMMNEKGAVIAPDNKYVVYSDGTIQLPLLNTVQVAGLTIKELNEALTTQYRRYLKQPYVKTSVLNHKVFALGEVAKRGPIAMDGESISIIEVLAKAGGLTDYAIRDRVRIISEENGEYILRTLNLNKFSTLNNSSLMLKHNSIVYIEPKDTKAVRVALNDYVPIIQAISSVLSTFVTISILNK